MTTTATPVTVVHSLIEKVSANKQAWFDMPAHKRLEYLVKIQAGIESQFSTYATRSNEVRHLEVDGDHHLMKGIGAIMGAGMLGGYVVTLAETYETLVATGSPPVCAVRAYKDVQVAHVYPYKFYDKVLGGGKEIEVWMEPGKSASQGTPLTRDGPGLCGILGAGNFEAPTDILTKMFVESKVVVYKTHPNNAHSNDAVLPTIFKSLIDDGFLAIVSGAGDVGSAVLGHAQVDEALMTGGCATYDCIVWGSPAEQEVNKNTGQKKLNKRFDAELGAVSPWFVVPGQWTAAELDHQADLLVASKLANSGAICASPQVVILDADWPQRGEFLDAVRERFRNWPLQPVFYPGTADRAEQMCANAKNVERFPLKGSENSSNPILPILVEVEAGSPALRNEVFAPVLSVLPIKTSNNPEEFMREAVRFANEELFGTLSCSLMIDPRTELAHKAALEEAIYALRYGSIGVNDWALSAAAIASARWGGYPGAHTAEDIQSGQGDIGNARLFDHPAKSVVRGSFVSSNHQHTPTARDPALYSRVAWFLVRPNVWRLLSVVSAAAIGI